MWYRGTGVVVQVCGTGVVVPRHKPFSFFLPSIMITSLEEEGADSFVSRQLVCSSMILWFHIFQFLFLLVPKEGCDL